MRRITIETLEAKAQELNITIERTVKGGKVAWKLINGEHVTIVQGTQATMDVLQFMAGMQTTPVTPDFTLYAKPINIRDTVFVNPKPSTKAIMAVVDAPEKSAKEINAMMQAQGATISKGVVAALTSDVHKVLRYLQTTGRLLAI